jgi:hypothetical protein
MSKLSDRDLSLLLLGWDITSKHSVLPFDLETLCINKPEIPNNQNIIKYGANLIREIISEFLNSGIEKILVPLSGGYDSRLLLALLMEHTKPSMINTLTYGTPGSFDYEIGRRVAIKAGTNHKQINLEETYFTIDCLKYTATQTNNSVSVFHQPPLHLIRDYYSDFSVFSGAYGGTIAGAKSKKHPPENLVENFFNNNLFIRKQTISDDSIISILPLVKYLDLSILSNCEKLDRSEILNIYYRQNRYIKSAITWRDFNIITPFSHPKWVQFMLALPKKYRLDRRYYRELIKFISPTLNTIPFKSEWEKIRIGRLALPIINKSIIYKAIPFLGSWDYSATKYLDFSLFYHNRSDFKMIEHYMLTDDKFCYKYSNIIPIFKKTTDINFKLMVISLFIFYLNREVKVHTLLE